VVINVITFFILTATTTLFVSSNFKELEFQKAGEDLRRIQVVFNQHLADLEAKAKDWSMWDEPYNFIQTLDPQFITDNVHEQNFLNLKINYLMFYNNSGEFVWGSGFDFETRKFFDVKEDLKEAVKQVVFSGSAAKSSGLVTVEGMPVAFAALPVYRSTGEGPSPGFIVFAENYDEDDKQYISKLTNLNFELIPAYKAQQLLGSALLNGSYKIQYERDQLEVYGVIKDSFEKPAWVVNLKLYRDMYLKSLQLLASLLFAMVVVTGLSTAIWAIYSDRLIFSRMNLLSKQIYQLRLEKSFDKKIKVDGNDEISVLAKNLNELVQSLSGSEKNYLKANGAIKLKAVELERKTMELEKLNQHMVGREIRMAELKKEIDELKRKLDAKNG